MQTRDEVKYFCNCREISAVTEKWDGDVGLGTRGLGNAGTGERRDVGLGGRRDVGRGTPGLGDKGDVGRENVETRDVGRRDSRTS